MTIVATPDAGYTPPRVTVDLTLPADSVMNTVQVWRVLGTKKELIRQQPVTGFDSRTVYDYECPYGVALSYQWKVNYFDPGSATTLWVEDWASIADWTEFVSNANDDWVAGATLEYRGASDPAAYLQRTLVSGAYQFVFASAPIGVRKIDFGGFYIDVTYSKIVTPNSSVTFQRGVTGWTVTITPDGASIRTSAGTWIAADLDVYADKVKLMYPNPTPSLGVTVGSTGSGNNQFNDARGIAIDPSNGDYYVCDRGNGKVKKYNEFGTYLLTLGPGTTGSGNGQFASPAGANGGPWDVALDASYRPYVTDPGNGRVQRFTAAGAYDAQFPVTGGIPKQISIDTAVAPYEKVYVSTYDESGAITQANQWVKKYSTGNALLGEVFGQLIATFSKQGLGDGEVQRIVGMTLINSRLYVLTPQRVQVFNVSPTTPTYLRKWDIPDAANGGSSASAISSDRGRIYVGLNTSANTPSIYAYSNTGVFQFVVATRGTGAGQFTSVKGLYSDPATSMMQVVDSVNDITSFYQYSTVFSGALTVKSLGATLEKTETSSVITLNPTDAWAIHPASPSLSVPISYTDLQQSMLAQIGVVSQRTKASTHDILGKRNPIHVTTGPRAGDELALTLATGTPASRKAIGGLLENDMPILIRIPPAWDVDFDEGFFAVGDVSADRQTQLAGYQTRFVTLPLTAVDSPEVTQVNTGWTWADLLAEFATWQDVFDAFENWSDVLTNTRRPGF